MKRREGFTLAEVLITLTIIGVISALTLPAIQSNTAANRNRVTLKNTMAILSQAAQNNMDTEGWNYSHIVDDCGAVAAAREQNSMDNYSICGLMNSNLTGETLLGMNSTIGSYSVADDLPTSYSGMVHYQLANGAVVGLHMLNHGTNCREDNIDHNCLGYIDVNGFAGPNRTIKCANGTQKYSWEENYDARTRTCEVERTTNADTFPIAFYGTTIELVSDAARSYVNAR